MSRERTNVIGIVALTICVTAAALVGGWLAYSRYLGLGQQTVTAAAEEAPAAPAPRKKAARAPRSDGGRPVALEVLVRQQVGGDLGDAVRVQRLEPLRLAHGYGVGLDEAVLG